VAVHKFSSCDGCQLAFLNLGEDLLALAERVDLVHFAEAGPLDPDTDVDIAFVEGSVSTPEDLERIQHIRTHSRLLIAIGACATSGGIQGCATAPTARWTAQIYSHPEAISSLERSTPIASHVKVDFELWGCPVSGVADAGGGECAAARRHPARQRRQGLHRMQAPRLSLRDGQPRHRLHGAGDARRLRRAVPGLGRDCYGCYGPAENANTDALAAQFAARA
jgi:sulfhydrogenase subunit delta